MVKKIDHIGVAVTSAEEGMKLFQDLFGIKGEMHNLPEMGMKAVLLDVGGVHIELLEPTDPNGAVGRFLQSKGEGIHHICLEVDDVDKELQRLANKGVSLVDKQGRKGLTGKVGFIHPRSTRGVLVELAQKV